MHNDAFIYKRHIPHMPKKIKRDEFISIVFEIGFRNGHSCDTVMIAVKIGDYFISYKGSRTSYCGSSNDPIMLDIVPQYYSEELAYTVSILSAKFNEDGGCYNKTSIAAFDTNNYYVYKMEWEIFEVLDYHIKPYNIIPYIDFNFQPGFRPWIRDFCQHICLYAPDWKPTTVIIAMIILSKYKTPSFIKKNRQRRFLNLAQKISHEYEISLSDFFISYIKIHQKSSSL